MTIDDVEEFVSQYCETMLWCTGDYDTDNGSYPEDNLDERYSVADVAPELLERVRREATDFIEANASDLTELDARQCGHDFALTRNGHGAGFWDRGYGDVGDRLTEACRPYGEDNWFSQSGAVYGDAY